MESIARKGGFFAMFYPVDFSSAIKEEFSEREDIVSSVEDGEPSLGRFLAEESRESLDPNNIIKAFESGRPETILEKAKVLQRRKELFERWIEIVSNTNVTKEDT